MSYGDERGRCYLAFKLERLGVSPIGARQFANGDVVTSRADRVHLATMMDASVRLLGPSAHGLLLQAVKSASR